MTDELCQLVKLFELEKIDSGLFRGRCEDTGWGRVYGGQVLGQALAAANQQVEDDRIVHSFHSYFLRPGDPSHSIVYDVEALLDAGTIASRRVAAIQNGQPIFLMAASFQRQLDGYAHQKSMPAATPPEQLTSESERERQYVANAPDDWKPKFNANKAIDFRPVQHYDLLKPEASEPVRQLWMRANGELPDDPRVHEYLLAYASDYFFLATANQPHGLSFLTPGMRMATIDHSMWFHRPFRFDDWLLYHMESPSSSNGRGFVTGHIYDRAGQLVASTAQEGIMRVKNTV